MQTVEITAKSVQDATQQAAERLGVGTGQVRVTILEETKGLFGKSSVRVKAEVIEAAPAPDPVVEAPAPAAAAPAKPARGRKAAAAPAPVEVAAPVVAPEPEPEAAPAKPEPRRGRGRREAPAKVEATAEAPAAAPAPAEAAEELVATAEEGEALASLVREFMESAKLNVTVSVGGISGRYVSLTLDGKDVAFIVGKHGEVLNNLQYLVNIVASRRLDRNIRATLDGNDYRRRREEALTQLAQKIAEQVKARGEEAVLDALPAFERRIVHKALGEIDGITTYSEGEEPNRRVVIAPAD